MLDPETKKEIIMEHYLNPINRMVKDNPKYKKFKSKSETCIDDIDLYVLIEDNVIKDITFDGEACAICTSATSIMIETLIGKTKKEALEILKNYEYMIDEKEYNSDILEQAIVYSDIAHQPNRKKCALLSWWGIKKALKGEKKKKKI